MEIQMKGTGLRKSHLVALLILVIFVLSTYQVMAKSLYVIASINARPTPIHAYDIQPAPNYLAFQSEHGVPHHAGGGVGIAVDGDSATLFITYEHSNIIELINATTMNSTGNAQAPGAENLAGIVYDRRTKRVYAVDRMTNDLYVYSWDYSTRNLTLLEGVDLAGVKLAHGLALDESRSRLYVGDMLNTTGVGLKDNIKVFSTKNWESLANYTVNQSIQAIALDARNGFVYTGHSYMPYGGKGLLVKLDMNTMEETSVSIPNITGIPDDCVVGIAVDTDTGLIYITTGNQGSGGSDGIMVFDPSLDLLHTTYIVGGPTGITVPTSDISYNPLSVEKTSSRKKLSGGDLVTYTISFDNSENDYALTNVIIEDFLPPELEFVDASNGYEYYPETRRVTWLIDRVEPGAGRQELTVRARVARNVSKGEIVGNAVTVDSDQTPPTTQRAIANVSGFSIPFVSSPAVRDGALVGGVLVASYAVGWGAAAGLTKLWLIPKGAELSTQLMLGRVTKYGITVLGGLMALAQTEINAEPVLLGAGVAGIAFAFGAKDIIANIVSGIIIMIDRPIKRGDIVEVEGAVGEVLDIGLRASTIRTLDNINHIIPNTVIILNRITNFSKHDPKIRLQVPVRVAYGSEMDMVKEIIHKALSEHPKVLEEPAPEVRIVQFGESSVDLVIFAWVEDPAERFRINDEINWTISQRFSENGIKIPFDQKDLWLRDE